jgi:hypothetical protein
MVLYKIYSTIYLDKFLECYKRIIVIDKMPLGELSKYVKTIHKNKLSPFDENSNCDCVNKCMLSIMNFENKNEFLCIDNITELFDFLITNNYTIDTSLSKIITKNNRLNNNDDFICFISYKN